jgi:ABC-2 type transport system permease protein
LAFLIQFFMRIQLKSRRLVATALLGLFPVLICVILVLIRSTLEDHDVSLSRLYPQVSFFLYLHFILPILAVFAGSSLIGDEIEEQTLPYLVVRPIPKWWWLAAKFLAQYVILAAILLISLTFSYTLLNLQGWLDEAVKLLKSVGVLLLGLAAYLSLFSLFGAAFKKPIPLALLFTFGWENLVAYFPGNAKLLTVVHYLHSLFPTFFRARAKGILGMIPFKFQLASEWVALSVLIVISAASLAGAMLILTMKEYRLSRD